MGISMATIYSNQMSGAWKNRIAREEKQLLQQIAPHVYGEARPPSAPAHHSAPFATDLDTSSRPTKSTNESHVGNHQATTQKASLAPPPTAASSRSRASESRAQSRASESRAQSRATDVSSRMSNHSSITARESARGHPSEYRPDTAASMRSQSTCTSIATSQMRTQLEPSRSGRRTAGLPGDHMLKQKMKKLELQVEEEKNARIAMEREVQELRSEVCSSRGASRRTNRAA